MSSDGVSLSQTGRRTARALAFYIRRIMVHLPAMSLLRTTLDVLRRLGLLAGMLVVKVFYDALQGDPIPGFSLPILLVLTALLGLGDVTLGVLRGGVHEALGFRIIGWLRQNLLGRILDRPGARALPGTVGEALSTLGNDVGSFAWVSMLPSDLFTYLVFYGGGLVILLRVDVRITLLVLLPMLTILLLSRIGRGLLERTRAQSREAAARFAGGLGELLASVQAVQVAGAEDKVVAHLRRLGEVRQQATLRDWLQQGLWGAVFQIPWTAGMGLVLLAAAAKMRSRAFTVGDLALYVAYLNEVGELLFWGGGQLIQVRLARVAVERVLALLRGPRERLVKGPPLILRKPLPTVTSGATASAGKTPTDRLERLQVVRLTLRHDGSDAGIEDVSFTLERGTLTAIVGRIGAGKTTLLRALLGLLPIDGGEVRWNGARVDDLAVFCVPPRVAYTPQVPVLLSDTLRENVLLGVPDEPERLARAIRCAVLERDVAEFPNGLDTRIGVRGMKLSGGQVQRTAAARMFVREPELFVLDDISSALDVETEQLLWQRLFDEDERQTCLVVSHRRAVLERADQILVMEHGQLTARGTLAELLETSEEMQRLYRTQDSLKQ